MRGGSARARRKREDMQEGQAAIVHQRERVLEHVRRFRRKAGDNIGAEDDIRTHAPHGLAKGDGVRPRVTALHPLQGEIVARLQGQMQMGHQPFILGDGCNEIRIRLDGIDGRQP
jgi:hypothetical protein